MIKEPTQIELIWQDLNEGLKDKALEKLLIIIEELQGRLDSLEGKNG